jgi:hypothetical protein
MLFALWAFFFIFFIFNNNAFFGEERLQGKQAAIEQSAVHAQHVRNLQGKNSHKDTGEESSNFIEQSRELVSRVSAHHPRPRLSRRVGLPKVRQSIMGDLPKAEKRFSKEWCHGSNSSEIESSIACDQALSMCYFRKILWHSSIWFNETTSESRKLVFDPGTFQGACFLQISAPTAWGMGLGYGSLFNSIGIVSRDSLSSTCIQWEPMPTFAVFFDEPSDDLMLVAASKFFRLIVDMSLWDADRGMLVAPWRIMLISQNYIPVCIAPLCFSCLF